MTFFASLTNAKHSRGVCQHFKRKIQVLLLYIKTLYEAMVIDSHVYIMTLYKTIVIDFLMFTSRPSSKQWSLIFLYLHQGPLRDNGHWFPSIYIKTLYEAMVIDFLMFTSRSSTT